MSKVKRVVHVLTSMNMGGAETFIMNMYRNIDRSKIQFDFILHTKEEGYYDAEIKSLGGRIINIEGPEKIGILKYRKVLTKAINENGPFDAIHAHAHFFNGVILNAGESAGINTRVSHSHSSQDGASQSVIRKVYRELMKFFIINNATDLLSCSDKASKELYGCNDSKVMFIPNSVNFDLYKDTTLDLRKELGLKENSLLIGHVGSFKDVKNHGYILKVFREICSKVDNVNLILVGDGELRTSIEEEAKNIKDKVHFLGIRGDVCDIIQNFNLFIFPSKFEGLPVSLVEIQAAKVKALVSDNITKNLLFTDELISYLSLDDFDLWVEKSIEILSEVSKYNKDNVTFKNRDFDVKNSVKKLEHIYLKKPN